MLDAGSAAHAYYPERSVNGDWEGDVWFNTTETYLQNQSAGGYGYFVSLHEIGHTLGLKHLTTTARRSPTDRTIASTR